MSKRAVPTIEELPDVLTAQNIADHLQISRNKVYELCQLAPSAGGLPSYPVGYGTKPSQRVDKIDFVKWKEVQKQRKAHQFAGGR